MTIIPNGIMASQAAMKDGIFPMIPDRRALPAPDGKPAEMMARLRDQGPARRLNAIALAVSIAIAVVMAANHLFTAYDYESQRVQSDTLSIASDISRLAAEIPDSWQDQESRIRDLADRAHSHAFGIDHDPARQITVREISGTVITEIADAIDFPAISGSSTVMNGAVAVGTVTLAEDVTHIWAHATIPLSLGIALGFAVFLILRYLPIRTLLLREQQLHETTLQLREAQKMEAIGQLTGGIAHDFNNLLCVVLGNLELVQESLDRQSPGYKFAQSAIGAAQRGATLTQQLLSFARKQILRPKIVELNELISGTTGMLYRSLGETIRIETELADDLWQTEIDPVQMETAIVNLATNARHAMPDGGVITIKTSNARLENTVRAQLDEIAPGPYVTLTFTDTGVGIPADILPRVFEPFLTTREVGQGSGLGLSMVYGFIRQTRGHVTIDSEEGAGTAVTLYFPAITGTIPSETRGQA